GQHMPSLRQIFSPCLHAGPASTCPFPPALLGAPLGGRPASSSLCRPPLPPPLAPPLALAPPAPVDDGAPPEATGPLPPSSLPELPPEPLCSPPALASRVGVTLSP